MSPGGLVVVSCMQHPPDDLRRFLAPDRLPVHGRHAGVNARAMGGAARTQCCFVLRNEELAIADLDGIGHALWKCVEELAEPGSKGPRRTQVVSRERRELE